jgi:DNA-binding transcriptional ArsR family regulator
VVNSADLLLHPVRLRIVQAFLGDRQLTTTQLRAELADVPAASLYRHVARLVEAGVLRAGSERGGRGSVERTYRLGMATLAMPPDEAGSVSAEEHRQTFMAFTAGLLRDFDRYLEQGNVDLLRDGVGYRMAGLWLDDAEHADLLRGLERVLQARMANTQQPGRRRRIIAYVLLPGEKAT